MLVFTLEAGKPLKHDDGLCRSPRFYRTKEAFCHVKWIRWLRFIPAEEKWHFDPNHRAMNLFQNNSIWWNPTRHFIFIIKSAKWNLPWFISGLKNSVNWCFLGPQSFFVVHSGKHHDPGFCNQNSNLTNSKVNQIEVSSLHYGRYSVRNVARAPTAIMSD